MNTGIEAVRLVAARWTEAIEHADLEGLARLMADDIVVVHGNGRILEGKPVVLSDLGFSLRTFSVRQEIDFDETIVAGDWAFDRATIRTILTSRLGGETRQVRSRTFTLLKRTTAGGWLVARTIGVVVAEHE